MLQNRTKTKVEKVIFLDRDGVINKKPEEGSYITDVIFFEFNKKIFNVLKSFASVGYKIIIITNQRGISRGLMSVHDLGRIHEYMKNEMLKNGIKILDIFYCPHGIGQCLCRKPAAGMLEEATKKHSIDLSKSILISDERRDIEMGRIFGVSKNILVKIDDPTKILELVDGIKI